ncbi:hypothetical protein BDA96_09G142600 [Sorghum bicolor]|uniref:Uncharacterized protein n=2 Tax=Sorghum bicolor TaxID=4558 RepID=A0A921QA11_SORBI|nr:hypothetical protein BDA96_09G142600 [Sorghum bicolor]OQU78004.1 hypothetical protein SORBI_3009G135550 [Sorghum bicolor]
MSTCSQESRYSNTRRYTVEFPLVTRMCPEHCSWPHHGYRLPASAVARTVRKLTAYAFFFYPLPLEHELHDAAGYIPSERTSVCFQRSNFSQVDGRVCLLWVLTQRSPVKA